ncbi:MAG: M48 family metalloprotease [Gammaproteobacteria bacterium]|nr:M48 family metalloprotease [Gammaproteobacteria bacterium]
MMIPLRKLSIPATLLIASFSAHAFDFGFGGGDDSGGGPNFFDIGEIVSGVKDISRTVTGINEEDEIEIGRDAAAVLLGASKPVNNPELQRYVNRVGRWVVNQTDRAHLPWRFAVLRSNAVNAFATPGGNIFITDGLLHLLNSEAELAAVLAHEVAHVVQKHHIKAMSSLNTSGLSGVIKLASLTREGRSNQMTSQLVGQVKDMYLRGLDKDDEFEADSMGTIIASRAGYDPFALMAVLQTLDSIDPENSGLALLYKTHPPASDRLDKLEPVLEQFDEPTEESPKLQKRFNQYVGKHS